MCQICFLRMWYHIRRSASLCTPPICCVEWAAWSKIQTRMAASGLRSMQYPATELRRIPLPRTPVNKGARGSRRSPRLLRIRSVEEDSQQRCHHDKHPHIAYDADVSHLHVADYDPTQAGEREHPA